MDKIKFIMMGVSVGIFSSCAQTKYEDVQTSEIKHSSPDVISLYEAENEKNRREHSNGGAFGFLIDSLLGSDPDDDDIYGHYHHRDHSQKRKRQFISKNGETLRSKLEAKKQ